MTIHVHTGGADTAGPAVIFLHGAGMDHTIWRFQTRWLAHRGFRVLAPDLPGHGASGGEVLRSVEDGAAWLAGFLADHRARGTLIGSSMGAVMALEAAQAGTDVVSRLVLVGAGPRMSVHPELMAAASHDVSRAARLIAGWSMPVANRGGHPEPGTWEQGTTERLVEASRAGVLAADLAACAAYDAYPRAADLRVPTTVISGSDDRMVPNQAARDLAAAIPGAEFITVEGAGHEPMVQQPRAFNRILAEILNGDGKLSDL